MPIPTDHERLGTTLGDGRYRLRSLLGRGGMGTVFEAVHEWTGRQVAVKLLRHDLAADVEASQRFLREARSATAIDHPNVVEVLDMGRHDEWTVYMVLELLRGKSLADRLDAVGRLTPLEAAMILLPVADAVAAAHRLGIIHRDLKPDNIFLEDDGMGYIRPKLLDFGIARAAERAGSQVSTGVIAGTPEYLSPEHARGFRAGPASDVWSLGVVLFECLTGTLPFVGDNVLNVLLAITSNPIPSLRGDPEVPVHIAELVENALVRDPEARIPSADAFRDALAAAAELQFQASRSRSVPSKILCESSEVALSGAHHVERRQSTPTLGSIVPVRSPLPIPAGLSAPSQATATTTERKVSAPSRHESATLDQAAAPEAGTRPEAAPTMAELSEVSPERPEAAGDPARPQVWTLARLGILALLVIGVLALVGYRVVNPEHAPTTSPSATGRDSLPATAVSNPRADRNARPTSGPDVASMAASAEAWPTAPASSAIADDMAAASSARPRGSSARSPSDDAPPLDAPEPGPSPASAATATPEAGSTVERGANGSLILD